MSKRGGTVVAVVLVGCAAIGEVPGTATPRPQQGPAPVTVGAANTAPMAEYRARQDEENRAAAARYEAVMQRNQAEAEARAKAERDQIEALKAQQKAATDAEDAECRRTYPERKKAHVATLSAWQAWGLRVGPHRKTILENCRIGEKGLKTTRTPSGTKGQALSVEDRVDCRGGRIPGGVSREDAVTAFQVDPDEPIEFDDDGCRRADAADGRLPKITITDLLRKPKP